MLHECIDFLIKDLEKINAYYQAAKDGREFNFVIDIQPFTENIDSHLYELITYRGKITQFKLMNDMKLDLLVQHMRELSVECFFEKTSRKVFFDKYKAVQHDLHYMARQ